MIEQPPTDVQNPPPTPKTGDVVGKRIVAALIDIVILGIVFIVMAIAFGSSEAEGGNANVSLTGGSFVLFLLIDLAYYIGFEVVMMATPGKLAMSLRIASADETPLTPGRIALRNILRIVDGLPVLYLVGLVTVAASKRNQRIGDMAARSVVVAA